MNKYDQQIFQFKIFGERHTATNAIAKLLAKHFDLDYPYYDFLGWKHRKAPSKKELQAANLVPHTLFIITVRHPYEWVAAMHRCPYCDYDAAIHLSNLEGFIRYPIEDYANVLDMWNQKYASYKNFIQLVPFAKIIRFEDFQRDQLATLQDLYKWLPKPRSIQPIVEYTHGGNIFNIKLTERTIGTLIYRHWLVNFSSSSTKAPSIKKPPIPEVPENIINMIDQGIDQSVLSFYYPDSSAEV